MVIGYPIQSRILTINYWYIQDGGNDVIDTLNRHMEIPAITNYYQSIAK
jgi:hypothetical protein